MKQHWIITYTHVELSKRIEANDVTRLSPAGWLELKLETSSYKGLVLLFALEISASEYERLTGPLTTIAYSSAH